MCFLLLCPQKLHSKDTTSFITKWPHFLTPASHHYFSSKWVCSQTLENFQLPYPREKDLLAIHYSRQEHSALLLQAGQNASVFKDQAGSIFTPNLL